MKLQYLGFVLPIVAFVWLFIWSWIPIKLEMSDYLGQNVIKCSTRIVLTLLLMVISLIWALS
jgi:hypothetical protein